MGSPNLFDTLTQQVAQQSAERLDTARREAASIVEAARAETAKAREDALDDIQRELDDLAHAERERTAREVQRTRMFAREAIVEELLEQARQKLPHLAEGGDFQPALGVLLEEALQDMDGNCVVEVAQTHEAFCRDWLRQHGFHQAMVKVSNDVVAGVVVRDPEDTFRVTNTLASRFDKLRGDARALCLAQLAERSTATDGA